MPIMLNTLFTAAGLPLKDIRLLRHKDKRATKGRSPYELWRDRKPLFDMYQSSQRIKNRTIFSAPFWASFVVDFNDNTLFCGIYRAEYIGLWEEDTPMPHIEGEIEKAGTCDRYKLDLSDVMADLIGKMFIDWGQGERAWCQHAARNDKTITELRTKFIEDTFPGFLNFIEPLSKIERLPASWIETLRSSQGVYLLTCPKTKEQYVGSATGESGFWGRWLDYVRTGHGGNVGLKSRDPSDYQVSILEVAGTSSSPEDILRMEGRWQSKLQSKAMGLNRNAAG